MTSRDSITKDRKNSILYDYQKWAEAWNKLYRFEIILWSLFCKKRLVSTVISFRAQQQLHFLASVRSGAACGGKIVQTSKFNARIFLKNCKPMYLVWRMRKKLCCARNRSEKFLHALANSFWISPIVTSKYVLNSESFWRIFQHHTKICTSLDAKKCWLI